ncbi:hypothetical protein EYF80_054215 [Liparis tanakae]|uniref:Uncharacterized protein n=1 Tax=Liparis tanakae TaxID=230148 RepID=A0A4Z2F563_9TELE|nr:hypothetical protein EYF80_054215 [Liparis tanakae]
MLGKREGGREGRQGENEREGAIEKERRKRENKHAPNRLAIEREGKKEEERERERAVPKEKHKEIKGKGERGLEKPGSHKSQ